MLGDEYGTASNIKSRVNRLSVLGAITSAQQRLKLYNKVRLPAADAAMACCLEAAGTGGGCVCVS
jgi:peptide subunit release factor 1 (eRF1)